jgi:hypothetical protein
LSVGSEKEIDLRILVYAVRQELLYLLLKCRDTASFEVGRKPLGDGKDFRIDPRDENANSPKI